MTLLRSHEGRLVRFSYFSGNGSKFFDLRIKLTEIKFRLPRTEKTFSYMFLKISVHRRYFSYRAIALVFSYWCSQSRQNMGHEVNILKASRFLHFPFFIKNPLSLPPQFSLKKFICDRGPSERRLEPFKKRLSCARSISRPLKIVLTSLMRMKQNKSFGLDQKGIKTDIHSEALEAQARDNVTAQSGILRIHSWPHKYQSAGNF